MAFIARTPWPQRPLRRALLAFACLTFAHTEGHGAGPATQSASDRPPALAQALQALDEGIAPVAIQKLKACLSSGILTPQQTTEARRQLARAHLQCGQDAHALDALKPLLSNADPETSLLHARVLMGSGHWADALALYDRAATDNTAEAAAETFIGRAECQHALGDTAAAIATLETLLEKKPGLQRTRLRLAGLLLDQGALGKAAHHLQFLQPSSPPAIKWGRVLQARLLLLQGRHAEARDAFKEVLADPAHLAPELLTTAVFGATDARIQLEGDEAADQELEVFIQQNPESPQLELLFARLDEIYSRERNQTEGEFKKWIQQPPPRRAALALFYLARMQVREGDPQKASEQLTSFVAQNPSHPLLPRVHQMQAGLLLDRKDFPGALRSLEAAARHASDPQTRAGIELQTGIAHYRAGDFLLAANCFENARRRDPALSETCLFNEGLAALQQAGPQRFEKLAEELGKRFPKSPLRGELALEHGLVQARKHDNRAAATLRAFLHQFPSHSRTPEARLALAELAAESGDWDAAEDYRRVVNTAESPKAVDEQSEYLALYLLDAQGKGQEDTLVQKATDFLRNRPGSPLATEVRMKLAQVYFRRNDFANAETQFATVAREAAQSPYAETALFLAGQSAMRTINTGAVDRALDLFDQVAKRDGPLKLHAREQQAVIQRQLEKDSEAVKLYDIVLGSKPAPDRDLLCTALAGKGDALLSMGRKDPAQNEAAVRAFQQLAELPEANADWRNQALYKKGKAAAALGRQEDAIAAYFEVLAPAKPSEPERFWYYTAGFELARLFESQRQWKPAIAVYEKIAAQKGSRTDEARAQIKRVRLEHFVWE